MKKTACIVAAGKGTRSFHYPFLHKALLPLGNKAVISHCLDLLSNKGIERFVIALQKGEESQIKAFLNYIHSDKKIDFVICNARDGSCVGPGRTLELCKEFLGNPFIAMGCDTLGEFDLSIDGDWITTSNTVSWKSKDKFGEYAYFDKDTQQIKRGVSTNNIINNKNKEFFSGVIGVEDISSFWDLSSRWNIKGIEKPIYAGFQSGMFNTIPMYDWVDTGSNDSYIHARNLFKEIVEPKRDQEIFIYKDRVIKFFNSEKTCEMLITRHNLLQPFSPLIYWIDKNLISYKYIKGKLLSETKEIKYIDILLKYLESQVRKVETKGFNIKSFRDDCNQMWFQKLEQRILSFDKDLNLLDKISNINGIQMPRIKELIKEIDKFLFLENCIPCVFHGDPSPENIIFDEENNLKLIDPRPIFGKSNVVGDLYYELAKIDHALLVNGKSIRSNNYGYKIDNSNKAIVWIEDVKEFSIFRDRIYKFCRINRWSTTNLCLATSLTILSICSVHRNQKYNNFLLLTGKFLLKSSLEKINNKKPISIPISLTH